MTTKVTTPTPVALKGIPDVELVAVGKWKAGTGVATITDDDVRAAVAALDCPGIHNPVIKLGHQEPDPDATRIRWDGEPAVGWIANMRLSTNGAKILGDYTGVPAWLVDVMPSAYPQRSVEIQRDFLCQIGHVHPFVITAVSLLGVAPPAVGVIKSLHDVQALYTLAAADGHPPDEVTASIAYALALPAETRRPLTETEIRSGADFDRDRDEWDAAVAALLTAYSMVQRRQREQLTAQIAPLVDSGRYGDLAALTVDPQPAADLIYAEMLLAASAAIELQIIEAATQGMIGLSAVPDEFYLRRVADGIAATMAATMAATAGRDAAQLAAPGVTGATVADSVNTKLSDLSDRFLRDQFAGAIGAARTAGRHAVLSVAPDGTYYAAEVNDRNTCPACKKIDGTRFPNLDAAMAAYGAGGYHLCSGGERCRGRMITVWEAAMGSDRLSVIGLRVGDRTYLARVADTLPPPTAAEEAGMPLRIAPSGPGRTLVLKFDPNQKRARDGKWTDGPGGGGGKSGGSGGGGVGKETEVPTGQGTEPMTDEEFEARAEFVSATINKARKTLSTDVTHTLPSGAWTPERDKIHREIAEDLYSRSNGVPNDGKAVIAGGLGGAGKTTVLTKHAGVDTSQYMTVNPDDIKEELAARGLIPEVPGAAGLSPMERAALVHEESSRIAHMLADRAYREKRNLIWDITMSSESSVKTRVDAMQRAGYGEVQGVFVDIPVETSVQRAMSRYRRGVDSWRAGKGPGGRYVPPAIIRAQKTSSGETINRGVFEKIRAGFTDSVVYDNSRTGEPPRKIG